MSKNFEVTSATVDSALEFLTNLATNPTLQFENNANKTEFKILSEIGRVFHIKRMESKKRKNSPTKGSEPKSKKTRTTRNNKSNSNNICIDYNIEKSNNYLIPLEKYVNNNNIKCDSPSCWNIPKSTINPNYLSYHERNDPYHIKLDNYLDNISNLYYKPIETIEHNLKKKPKKRGRKKKNSYIVSTIYGNDILNDNNSNNSNNNNNNNINDSINNNNNNMNNNNSIFRHSTLDMLLSPLRKISPIDEWNGREIALFESGICCKGKNFYQIAKIIGTKTTKECVMFYYYWKSSSHYKMWKILQSNNKNHYSNNRRRLHFKLAQTIKNFYTNKSNNNKSNNNKIVTTLHERLNFDLNVSSLDDSSHSTQEFGLIDSIPYNPYFNINKDMIF